MSSHFPSLKALSLSLFLLCLLLSFPPKSRLRLTPPLLLLPSLLSIDTYLRGGLYPVALPFTLGQEAAGTLVAVHESVKDSKLSVGDKVVAYVGGSYAEYVKVPAGKVFVSRGYLALRVNMDSRRGGHVRREGTRTPSSPSFVACFRPSLQASRLVKPLEFSLRVLLVSFHPTWRSPGLSN